MQQKRFLLIVVFFMALFVGFFVFGNKTYAYSTVDFETWLDTGDNAEKLQDVFGSYSYLLVRNSGDVVVYYAPQGTVFKIYEDGVLSGERRKVSSSHSEFGDNHFTRYVFNSSYTIPSSSDLMSVETLKTYVQPENNDIIMNYFDNGSNILANSNAFELDHITREDVNPFFRTELAEVLATSAEKAEPGIVLAEILKILPLILVVVVSFLGLRKALKMLLTLLARS